MTAALTLPPSITISPTCVGVSVLTEDGATVQIRLPRPGGLRGLSQEEIVVRAQRLAKAALDHAARCLGADGSSDTGPIQGAAFALGQD
ncbi:MAG: hypothetical protein P4L64_01100 [Caulobacteraceae bacterium]|nr:hypothetical protein [Caulobacteraceae bacterium]